MFEFSTFREILDEAKHEAGYWAGYKAYLMRELNPMDWEQELDEGLDLAKRAENIRQAILRNEKVWIALEEENIKVIQKLKYGYTDDMRLAYEAERRKVEDRIVVKSLDVFRVRAEFMAALESWDNMPLRKRQQKRVRKSGEPDGESE